MFSSTGLFNGVECPQGGNCSLLNCIFSHRHLISPTKNDNPPSGVLYHPTSAADPTEPPRKRRRVFEGGGHASDDTSKSRTRPLLSSSALPNGYLPRKPVPEAVPRTHQLVSLQPSKLRSSPAFIIRAVSPPLSRSSRKLDDSQSEGKQTAQNGKEQPIKSPFSSKESLTPRLLTPNPAPHPVRLAILKKIHEQLTRLNDEALKDQATKRELVLSETEIISMALDEEEKMGKDNPRIYKNVVGHRIQRLKKMKLDEWMSSLLEEFQKKYLPSKPALTPKEKTLETGLTAQQEIAVLAHLLTPLKGLEAHGYVTTASTAEEIKSAQDGIKAAGGFERCERCGTRFQVFPGRNSDETSRSFGRLTTTENGCMYHWSKPFRPPKSSAGAGHQESYYPCCRGLIGSKGCTQASDHVFKASEVKRMASILQFESTPWPKDPDRPRGPVTFDCEMGYTTFGMELIRLTALSWPQHQTLLDILVRPLGEVIDYNTRFSGVSQEHFSRALPHGGSLPPEPDDPSTSKETELEPQPEPLRVVDSPTTARALLFDLLTPSTPLLGHAIDNDLNTCRILHPTIVDTVLLFPHPRGLPIRYGLKLLAGKYLERSIQTSGAAGHDSKEDARATGDLVRVKVKEKWMEMRRLGWRVLDGRVVEPVLGGKEMGKGKERRMVDGEGKGWKRGIGQLDGGGEEEEEEKEKKEKKQDEEVVDNPP